MNGIDMSRFTLILITGLFMGLLAGDLLLLINPSAAFQYLYAIQLTMLCVLIVLLLLLGKVLFLKRDNTAKLEKAKQKAETQLSDYQNRFQIIFEHTNLGVAFLNLDGSLYKVNKSLTQMLGYSETDLLSMKFNQLIHPDHKNELQTQMQDLIDKKVYTQQSEHLALQKNNDNVWVMTTLSLTRDSADKPLGFILQVQNISLQKKAEERLRHMAYHDPLTGVANRNKLEQFINHMLATSRRHQQGFALLFLDLDRFKNINDTIGHEAGDLLLQIVAERLRNAVRTTDMVARLGGDEFVLLITDVKRTESVAIIAQKILESILKVIIVKGQELYISTSIGISLYPYDGQNLQALMKNADLALYRAKEHGRNNYQFYTLEMTGRAQEKMALQNALAHALVKNEFLLNYQPKMDLKTSAITGVEALLRWKNKEYGTITPDEIVALAEESGLIIPVSEWVLNTATKQLKNWRDMGLTPLTIAVNCSQRLFKQATFVDDVLRTLNEMSLPAQALEIEITESIIMQDPENTLRILYALKDLGVQIVIDDFGTGYWSLNNLRRLSVDKIKIDKTFIKQVTVDETSATITTAIIAMVNKLGIKSIAEGVETREQYDFLLREGCNEIQGYYLTQPLSDEAMTKFLKRPIPDAENSSKHVIIT